MESFDRIVNALRTANARFSEDRNGHAKATCPAHEDRNPSLTVDHRGDRTLMLCHAGCQTDDVVRALGLEFKDLFDDSDREPDRGMHIRSYVYKTAAGDPWIIKDRYWPKTFRLRRAEHPEGSPEARRGLQGRQPILYHLPELYRGIQAGERIWVVEGEKDVETAEQYGLVATTPPDAHWYDAYTSVLAKASEVVLVVDQDPLKKNGKLGTGHQRATEIRNALRAASVPVRTVRPREGRDLTDHFAAGFGIEDFRIDTALVVRPRGLKGDVLMASEFPPLKFCVPGLLPEGLAILAASPKAGKSWMALDLVTAVACGGRTLSMIEANQGDALYLAREDGYRRLQSRMDILLGHEPGVDLSRLEIIPSDEEWIGGEQGLAAMTEWADEQENPSLVVLDTWAKVEPDADSNDRYRQDYSMMARYKTWADRHHATVLVVHHDRKSTENDGDVFTKISGTRGFTGAADTMMYLERKRGESTGTLHLTGRDVIEQEIELHKSGPLWVAMGEPERVRLRAVE